MQRHQHLVDKAIVGKQASEDDGVSDQRGRVGQKDAGAEQAAETQIFVVQHGRQDQHDGDLKDQIEKGVEKRLLE